MQLSISLNMIVGPYYEPFLMEAVESARPVLDEIILVDTAPGQNVNRDVMDKIDGAIILEYHRKSEFEFHYGEARELARKRTRCQWFMRLDADEILPTDILETMQNHARVKRHSAVELTFYHHMIHPDYYVDTSNDPKRVLFRTKHAAGWVNPVHEICEITEGHSAMAHNLKYNHYGYVRGPSEVWKRWNLYEKLGGFKLNPHSDEPIVCNIVPEKALDGMQSRLIPYTEKHPDIVVPKLISMYPDLGTFPLGVAVD